jgi:hypothetical protein
MKRKTILALFVIAFALALNARASQAQSQDLTGSLARKPVRSEQNAPRVDSYEISWYTFDGGGATFSTGGTYSLGGTIGQADAGILSGGTYTLNGGFWNAAADLLYFYLPMILK